MSASLLIDAATAATLGAIRPPGVMVIESSRSRLRGSISPRRDPLDVVVGAVMDLDERAVVLARRGDALHRAASVVGRAIVLLPDDPTQAAWIVSVASSLRAGEPTATLRVLDVLAAGPRSLRDVPTRMWGTTGLRVPALRPTTLARRALRAWQPCGWCSRGGCPGSPCGGCGSLVPDDGVA